MRAMIAFGKMLKRYWLLCATLGSALVAFMVTLNVVPATAVPAAGPWPDENRARPREPRQGAVALQTDMMEATVFDRMPRHLEWLAAAFVGAIVAGLVVATAFMMTDDAALETATPCENFEHAQSLLAGGGGADGTSSLAERILSDGDDSIRIEQLRAMFDSCYSWAKG